MTGDLGSSSCSCEHYIYIVGIFMNKTNLGIWDVLLIRSSRYLM